MQEVGKEVKDCTCDEWLQFMASGTMYRIKECFKYCPWCGTYLKRARVIQGGLRP